MSSFSGVIFEFSGKPQQPPPPLLSSPIPVFMAFSHHSILIIACGSKAVLLYDQTHVFPVYFL
jgi:hypothetical protein